ncbi:MAG TPA: hemerythrin domain-containing protein [Armatimonadota bacterium]|jgi:hemerythrin-like domain-containing protein
MQIGEVKPMANFETPLALLSDCHRRVEKFLGVIETVATEGRGRELSAEYRAGLETALRYFQQAAPLHTQDEEASLFPRMREVGGNDVVEALVKLDGLEADHRAAEPLHEEVDVLGRKWLDEGTLPPEDTGRLVEAITRLRSMYASHIALEDTFVFPLAGRVLDEESLSSVGREMADRRGIPTVVTPGFSRCAERRNTTS